jgi:hypothetical protein
MKNKAPGENLRGLLVQYPLTGDRIRKPPEKIFEGC